MPTNQLIEIQLPLPHNTFFNNSKLINHWDIVIKIYQNVIQLLFNYTSIQSPVYLELQKYLDRVGGMGILF